MIGSTRPSPHCSRPKQFARQPSPPNVFPSSQTSPESLTLSPQVGFLQVVRQAFGVVSELAEPLSHCSPPSLTLSPQEWFLQVVRQAFGAVSEFLMPSSHSSLVL